MAHETTNQSAVVEVNNEEIPLLINNAPQKRSRTKHNVVKGIVFFVGVSEIFAAMVLQGAAAYVQTYKLEPNVPLSSAVGVSSHLGKFFLITMYNIDNLNNITDIISDCLLSPTWWKNIPTNVKNADWSKKGVGIKMLKAVNLGVGIVPGLTFGLLTELIVPDFIKLVQETKPGIVFNYLAEGFAMVPVKRTIEACSFNANLIASPAINYVTLNMLRDLKKEWQSLKTPYQVAKFLAGSTAGLSLSVSTGLGFYNFWGIGEQIGENYLNMSAREADAFGGAQFAYMIQLGAINAFPLGKWFIETVMDILTCQYKWPSKGEMALNSFVFLLTMVIISFGGLPNVWQAEYLGEDTLDAYLAEGASAITEYGGTFYLLKSIIKLIGKLIASCCSSEDEFINENVSDDKEVSINNDENKQNSWKKESSWKLKDCLPRFSICCGTSNEELVRSEDEVKQTHRQENTPTPQ